jgi:RNA polymerase sigma-70 factor (ECF subfamily)
MSKPQITSLAILSTALLSEGKFALAESDYQSPSDARTPSFFSSIRLSLSSDEELVRQLQQGNADSLTILFKRHSKTVFGIARGILRNDAEAEDAVQKVFFDVFRSIHQFDVNRGTFKTWLLAFAYHRSYNHYRSLLSRRYFEVDSFDDLSPEQWQQAMLHSRQSTTDIRMLLDEALAQIQPRQRRTIELIHFEGLTAEEVSIRTGETVRVVRHNLYRGMDRLRLLMFSSSTPDAGNRQGSRS